MATGTQMYKVITVYKRKPGLSVEEFQRRWLGEHAKIAATLPGLRRYVQSHSLVQGYRKGELPFDGISEMWFDTLQAWRISQGESSQAQIEADEKTLIDPDKKLVMPVEVLVIKDGAIPARAVKNIEFVNQRPGMDLIKFRDYWKQMHGPLASQIEVLRRYEQNHLQLDCYCTAGPAPAFDGLAITWFDSTADMKQGATTPIYALTRADECNFLPDGHIPFIVTTEHVIVG